ncbi:MAG: DUF1080 domain-containing protein [Verrucomicrobiae bacterium]|nr:DUF1080 domain-containing protein [Verrucomicrobiae bacterium]
MKIHCGTIAALTVILFASCSTGNKTKLASGSAPTPAATSTPAPAKAESAPSTAKPEVQPGEQARQTRVEPYAELPALEGEGWELLFDGVSLDGWKVTDFAGHGAVEVKNGLLVLEMGAMLTGVNLLRTNDIPRWDYELALDAMKLAGEDFFCGLTFVVGDSCCSFIVGGWGGGIVGISSIDGADASMNETTKFKSFEHNKWYRIRVRVTREKLEAWIGKEKMVDVALAGKRITVRPGEIEENQPFGIATYQTTAAFKNIQWRKLK